MLRFITLSLVSACGAFAADPGLLNLVMPDAKVMAGVNVTSAEASPLGQYLLAKISSDNQHLQKLISLTGFDPRIDLQELLLASSADPEHPAGIMLARGTFNAAEITAAAVKAPNVQAQTYDNDPLIVFTNPRTTNPTTQNAWAVAFIGNTIALAGPLAAVEAALDRSTATTPSISAALLAEVNQISAAEDEWVVSTVSPAALVPAKPTATASPVAGFGAALNNIQSFSGGIKFGLNDVLTAQFGASDTQNAAALADVLKFAITLITINAQKTSAGAEFAQILSKVKITVSGTSVDIVSSVPDAEVQTLLSTLPAPKKAN